VKTPPMPVVSAEARVYKPIPKALVAFESTIATLF